MFEKIMDFGGVVFYIAMFGLFVLGVYHSYNKHDDDGFLTWSPFSVYRGVEYFFHSESNEWEKEIPNVVYFLEEMKYNNPPDFNKDFSEFKERIDDFSDDGIIYLENFAEDWLMYRISFMDDFETALNNTEYNGDYYFSISLKTNEIRNNLKDYSVKERFEAEDKAMAEFSNYINDNLDEMDFEEFENIKSASHINIKSQKEMLNYVYQKIFE